MTLQKDTLYGFVSPDELEQLENLNDPLISSYLSNLTWSTAKGVYYFTAYPGSTPWYIEVSEDGTTLLDQIQKTLPGFTGHAGVYIWSVQGLNQLF